MLLITIALSRPSDTYNLNGRIGSAGALSIGESINISSTFNFTKVFSLNLSMIYMVDNEFPANLSNLIYNNYISGQM